MKQIKIVGGQKLSGTIRISGAKNSAVALIPAAILCDEPVTINNIPNISDIDALNEILEYLGAFGLINNQVVNSAIKGIFEMTYGINLVGMCDTSLKMKTIIASILVSFGGLSVIGQSMSMTRNTGIGFRDILEIKLTHGLIAGIVATLLVNNVVI